MHAFARRLTREDVYATLKFAIITVIILPGLPNRTFGPSPLNVLNPRQIWLMVVLISGISFMGYVAIKLVGPRQGIGLTGLLGGLISSTPVTISFSRRSREQPILAKPFALAITVAWAMTFPRVMVEVAALNAALLQHLWMPMGAAAGLGLVYSGYLYLSQRTEGEGEMSFSNPFELSTALQFGLLYAVVLLISKAVQSYTTQTGVYLFSIIAGLPDADAITLSMAELSHAGMGLDAVTAARAIVLGTMSNTAAKGAIALFAGGAELRRAVIPGLLLMLVAGVGLAFIT